jgi:hypothetical protein
MTKGLKPLYRRGGELPHRGATGFFSESSLPHCDYCNAPEKSGLKTYSGYTCRLYSEFMDICYDLGFFTMDKLKKECLKLFSSTFTDIPDIAKTVDELICIAYDDLGVIVQRSNGLFTV